MALKHGHLVCLSSVLWYQNAAMSIVLCIVLDLQMRMQMQMLAIS